jgi:SAM-dependent methyltransferase
MFKQYYSEEEFKALKANIDQRRGWDFSKMNTKRQPVPWKYLDVVTVYLRSEDSVLDIGTGGGENFLKLARFFKNGMGVDIDPEMIKIAIENARELENISFHEDNEHLENTKGKFNVILNRHAPFNLKEVKNHLEDNGYFITQQVGEKNMLNIKRILNTVTEAAVITSKEIEESGLKLLAFMEYDVEYVVQDVESLAFWLQALDMLHADIRGGDALENADLFNKILEGNVDERGFMTNEHRYLVIAQKI